MKSPQLQAAPFGLHVLVQLSVLFWVAVGQAALKVTPSVLCSQLNNVTVEWWGVIAPTKHDNVKIMEIPRSIQRYDFPVRQSESYVDGTGTASFKNVIISRHQLFVAYFRDGEIVAKEPLQVCTNLPIQIHLAHTSDPNEMVVSWNSNSSLSPIVQWGVEQGNLPQQTTGTSVTYTYEDMSHCLAVIKRKIFRHPGFFHRVTLRHLQPGTRYFYQCGNEEELSDEYSFFLPSPTETVQVLLVADVGLSLNANGKHIAKTHAIGNVERMIQQIHFGWDGNPYTLFCDIGDIAYAAGQTVNWDNFMGYMHEISSWVPYMTSVGNHDYDFIVPGERELPLHQLKEVKNDFVDGACGIPYFTSSAMPWSTAKNGLYSQEPWYSFPHGPLQVIVLSSEHNIKVHSAQWTWLVGTLRKVNRTVTPWLVVSLHRPMYSSWPRNAYDSSTQVQLRNNIEKAWNEAKVQPDVVWAGHNHYYERTNLTKSSVSRKLYGTIHITTGNGGQNIHIDHTTAAGEEWTAARVPRHGMVRIKVNRTHMYHEVLTLHGRVEDKFYIYKCENRQVDDSSDVNQWMDSNSVTKDASLATNDCEDFVWMEGNVGKERVLNTCEDSRLGYVEIVTAFALKAARFRECPQAKELAGRHVDKTVVGN